MLPSHLQKRDHWHKIKVAKAGNPRYKWRMARKAVAQQVSLRMLFVDLQKQMMDKLATHRRNVRQPTAKGDASERNWLEMFRDYLPERYCAEKAFVIDSTGRISEQIDVVIFDRQYSPLLFNQDGTLYVPAESVYAVFESKPGLSKPILDYAAGKAASVRNLKRTSAPIAFAAGKHKPKKQFNIIAGILAGESGWTMSSFSRRVSGALQEMSAAERIDLGCVLGRGAFDADYRSRKALEVEFSSPADSLIFFFLRFLQRLQPLGTVPAINYAEYEKALAR